MTTYSTVYSQCSNVRTDEACWDPATKESTVWLQPAIGKVVNQVNQELAVKQQSQPAEPGVQRRRN